MEFFDSVMAALCDVIYLHKFTHAHTASFKKKRVLRNEYYFVILKNKPISTKICPFFENTFKVKVMLVRTLFLILLTLIANI